MQNGHLLGRRVSFVRNYLGFKNFVVDTSINQLYAAFQSRSVILVDRWSQELDFIEERLLLQVFSTADFFHSGWCFKKKLSVSALRRSTTF